MSSILRNFDWSDTGQYVEVYKHKPTYGSDGSGKFSDVSNLIQKHEIKSTFDFGCGPNYVLLKKIKEYFPNVRCVGYDPAIVEHQVNDTISNKIDDRTKTDLLVSTDCLEHVPENELWQCWWIFKKIQPKIMFLVICTRKAGQILPDGSNAHKTVQSANWWVECLRKNFPAYSITSIETNDVTKHVKVILECNWKFPSTVNILDVLDKKTAYFITPKCGSRSMIGWFSIIRNPKLYVDKPELFQPSRTDMYVELRGGIPQLELDDLHNTKIRFCVVRDPVDRFVSAFTNRVMYLKKTKKELTISELIERYDGFSNDRETYGDIIHHTNPLNYFCGSDPSIFTNIFNIRQLNEVKLMLEETYGISLPNIKLQQSGDCKKPSLTDFEIQWIKNRYKEDYDIYGKWM